MLLAETANLPFYIVCIDALISVHIVRILSSVSTAGALGVIVLLSGCANKPHSSSRITREAGFALVVMPAEEPFTGRRLIGPEDNGSNGWLLRFETPFEILAPRKYRVPAGTVIFTLKRGRRTIRGTAPFGFESRPGETYELRLDEIGSPVQVTVIEQSSGRVASPGSTPRRYLKPNSRRRGL